MTSPLLHIAGLSLAFGGVRAIDDFSLDMHGAGIVSLIGPNGAGKTSIFNCINGTYRPTSGRLHVLGKDVTRMRPSAIAKLGVSRTFQNLRLFSDLTVLDNVRAGMHVRIRQSAIDAVLHTPRYRRTERHCTDEAHRWLDFVGFCNERGGPARNLPYGEQRRVEIARALARGPQLLLLDEPGAGLNHSEKEQLLDLLRRIKELGVGLVLIEHDMGVVMEVSERVVVLNFGKEIADGAPAAVKRDPAVVEAYLGKETSAQEAEQARQLVTGAAEEDDHHAGT